MSPSVPTFEAYNNGPLVECNYFSLFFLVMYCRSFLTPGPVSERTTARQGHIPLFDDNFCRKEFIFMSGLPQSVLAQLEQQTLASADTAFSIYDSCG